MRLEKVCRYSPGERLFRVARLIWDRGKVGDGKGYSAKLSLGLRPTLFRSRRECGGWILTLLGARVHYLRSYGGRS